MKNLWQQMYPTLTLGLFLLWLPLSCVWIVSPAFSASVGIYRFLVFTSLTSSFALLYVARLKLCEVYSSPVILALACGGASAFTLLGALSGSGVVVLAWFYLSAVVCGICGAWILMALIVSAKYILKGSGISEMIWAFTVLAVLLLVVSVLCPQSHLASSVILVACPVLVYVFFPKKAVRQERSSQKDNPDALVHSNKLPAPKKKPWHYKKSIFLSFAITGLALGLAFQEQFSTKATTLMGLSVALGIAFSAAVIAIIPLFTKQPINCFSAARIPLPYLCCYLVLLPFVDADWQWLMASGISAIWGFSLLFRIGISSEISNMLDIDSLESYGQMFLVRLMGLSLGIALSFVCQQYQAGIHPYLVLGVSFILASAISFFLADKNALPVWYLYKKDADTVLEKSSKLVAEQYSLTSREADVLLLLAKGRTAQYIADELSISTSTAKTHMKRLYAKLCVHSQQELLDIIESVAYHSLIKSS